MVYSALFYTVVDSNTTFFVVVKNAFKKLCLIPCARLLAVSSELFVKFASNI